MLRYLSHIRAAHIIQIVMVAQVLALTACGGGGSGNNGGQQSIVFSKTSPNTLSWSTTAMVSCEILNDQNSMTVSIAPDKVMNGHLLHGLPAGTTFTLTCIDTNSVTNNLSVANVDNNLFPQALGYYGSANSLDNSWSAIVNLTSPISFIDRIDFNSQVNSYCIGLGYVGVVKTMTGSFSTNATYYLQNNDGIIAGSGPSSKVTLIPGGLTFTNVYTNRRNTDSTNGNVGIATIGGNNSTIIQSVPSPTSGADQMVLCQTDIALRDSYFILLPQTIGFADPGPVNKLAVDPTFTNAVSPGLGSGLITFSSSNLNVATVNTTSGEVSLVGPGTTTITATKAGDAQFVQTQASYVLNVN